MRVVPNAGNDRVFDVVQRCASNVAQLDFASPQLSIFALGELVTAMSGMRAMRTIIPAHSQPAELLGDAADRSRRNRFETTSLARTLADTIEKMAAIRQAPKGVPQGALVARLDSNEPAQAILGAFSISSPGLGLSPGNPLSLIQASESPAEAAMIAHWFDLQWASLGADGAAKSDLISLLLRISQHRDPLGVYAVMLHHLLGSRGDALDEDRVVNAATGIRKTIIWKKLYKFQRDGVVGAIDKLNRFGGCIIADSVGLGKTFEALAVIKYHELRNDRVLVLCPKRLRDNWTLYATNDRRNILAADRFNYDVLNHTDLSRDGGTSGDIDLGHVNWGNYDLVVIDESHNFRNKKSPRQGGLTRYDRLMKQIIKEGVRTRVLMLSATPVNNRLADLRNQIAFATEGDDTALADHGIASIDSTTRLAQKQFNRWLELDPVDRTPGRLVEMLGFDYFKLLDLLTIARSRRHIEKYYGTSETGRFPDRRKPINVKADIDTAGEFRSIRELNQEIRRLNLSAYAPLRYVLAHKQEAYDRKYSTEVSGGRGYWRQVDREESLIQLLRVNVLKRLESSVNSFALTVHRQLHDVEAMLARIDAKGDEVEEVSIEDVDIDDPAFESLLVGRKVKVLLSDVDLVRWRQDLIEDRNRLSTLASVARLVSAERDAKLVKLKEFILAKCREPFNASNRKVLLFTAFADNLEVLKLLQKSYAGKVKLIYIDPPYNTGKDFVYPDDFHDSITNYLELTGQVQGGRTITTNTESSGRFHTDWLTMLYPRLKAAQALLRRDGVVFISIDDRELAHLRVMANEIFGEENFVAAITVVNNMKGRNDKKHVAACHEYVVVYAGPAFVSHGLPLTDEQRAAFKHTDEKGYRYALRDLRKRGGPDRREDRPNMFFPIFWDEASGRCSLTRMAPTDVAILPMRGDGTEGRWRWGSDKVKAHLDWMHPKRSSRNGRLDVEHRVYLDTSIAIDDEPEDGDDEDETAIERTSKPKSVWIGGEFSTDSGKRALKDLMPGESFDFPKSIEFLRTCILLGTKETDIVLDMFAGSGATGQAVMMQNAADGGSRRYVLVQLPEPLDPEDKNQKAAASVCDTLGLDRTIAELTKHRLRCAAKKLKDACPLVAQDLGFRVFRLDASNIRTWDAARTDLERAVAEHVEHLDRERTESDYLYELLLKRGLDLCVPIETKTIAGKKVHSVGAGSLIACLDTKITRVDGEALALGIAKWHKELNPASETAVVFRDDAFADDVAKTNVAAILEQHGLKNVRSL